MPIVLDGTNGITSDGTAVFIVTENIKTASHTAELVDLGKVIAMNNSANATCTIPPNSAVNFPIGAIVRICRIGAGLVDLVAGAGVTLSKTGSFALNEEITLRQRATNVWVVVDTPKTISGTGGNVFAISGFRVHDFNTVGSSTFVVS